MENADEEERTLLSDLKRLFKVKGRGFAACSEDWFYLPDKPRRKRWVPCTCPHCNLNRLINNFSNRMEIKIQNN